jgi:rRNA processing protein Krr1/Pno1
MENCDELSRHELLALKEIRLTGRTTDPKMALQLLNDDMIIDSQERCLQLTAKGRRMLVRRSPSLWDMAS